MKEDPKNDPIRRCRVGNHWSTPKRTSERPQRRFCSGTRRVSFFPLFFVIMIMLFVEGLSSRPCKAAGTEIRVGSETDFPPYALVDEKGRPDGFSVDLIKAVTAAMGLSVKISTGSWDTVWNSLVAGQIEKFGVNDAYCRTKRSLLRGNYEK
jgi:hypothetical protein